MSALGGWEPLVVRTGAFRSQLRCIYIYIYSVMGDVDKDGMYIYIYIYIYIYLYVCIYSTAIALLTGVAIG